MSGVLVIEPMRDLISLTTVKALRDGEAISDIRLEGFQVRRQGNAITYSVRRRMHGKNVRSTIGRHGAWTPDRARKEAEDRLRDMGKGIDPDAKRTGSAGMLSDVAPLFLDHIASKREPSTHREYKGHLDDHLLPKFGKHALDKITTGDLRKLHQQMSDRPTLANRIMDTLSSLYGWQQKNDTNKPLHNPATRKLVERYKEKGREYRLKPNQLTRLAKVLKDFEHKGDWSPFALAAIWLYLATGQRRDSIRTMQWQHVDWGSRTVTIHMKRRGMVAVPFNDAALAILRKLRAFPDDGNPYVIRGSKPGEPYKNIQDIWNAVRKAAKLDKMRIHDLRHHVGSVIGDTHHVATVAKVLGNTKAAAMRYIHADEETASRASQGIGDTVARLIK